jgi:2-dehydropantoate 2-reductase
MARYLLSECLRDYLFLASIFNSNREVLSPKILDSGVREKDMFKILVFGAGSVGLYLGTKLFAIGHEVTLYGRRKLRDVALTILINDKPYPVPPKIKHLVPAAYNLILVTTKLHDIPQAIKTIEQCQFNPQIIAFIQNGLIEKRFYGNLSHHPGFITLSLFNGYNLQTHSLSVVESNLGIQVDDSPVGQKLCDLFQSAGIHCQVSQDIDSMRAKKLILNAALNPLSALEQKTVGEVVEDETLQPLIDSIIQEGWAVLHSAYPLPDVTTLIADIYRTARQVPHHYSSTYQDLMSGRPTEINFLNGLIVQLGNRQGIATPYNQQVCQRILALEKQCTGMEKLK